MSLQRLARELDETARQTGGMVEGITEALAVLADRAIDPETARRRAANMIIEALQGQDRIEQRCRNMAQAVRQFDAMPASSPDSAFDEVWARLALDELRLPALSGIAARAPHGDVDLF